jgi:hypothetical protein
LYNATTKFKTTEFIISKKWIIDCCEKRLLGSFHTRIIKITSNIKYLRVDKR